MYHNDRPLTLLEKVELSCSWLWEQITDFGCITFMLGGLMFGALMWPVLSGCTQYHDRLDKEKVTVEGKGS